MKILYIAFVYHNNQVPIMEGWVNSSDEAMFVTQVEAAIADYSAYHPVCLGRSPLFNLINRIYELCNRKNRLSSFPEAFAGHYAFPSRRKVKRLYREWKPDLIIMRDRSLYNISCYSVAKKYKIPCLLYTQSPYWNTEKIKNDFLHRIVRSVMPDTTMTPVLGREGIGTEMIKGYYVPFVIYPKNKKNEDEYYKNGKINILCVAKYEYRKNQQMLLEAISNLKGENDIHLVYVGECSTYHHQEYYKQLIDKVKELDMSDMVELYINQPSEKMGEFYKDADLFVLPSTGEFASVSQMEAMSYSVAAIVSDTNGTSCYVRDGIDGYIFRDEDINDLCNKIELAVADREALTLMGQNAYNHMKDDYSFERYRDSILDIYTRLEV